MQTWGLWYPSAAANGLLVARARMEPHDTIWAHSAPDVLAVLVRDADEHVLAKAELRRESDYFPMTRLTRTGNTIAREDRWPTRDDTGAIVVLPGGEVGTLLEWWNAGDGSEWRWRVEFYNHR